MIENFDEIMQTDFTAKFEKYLDKIALGKAKWFNVLEKFKRAHIMSSIDGIKDTIEYQRYPCKWSVIEKNFIKLYNSNFKVELTPCITLLNYLDLYRLVDWANLFPKARLCYNELINPSYLDFIWAGSRVRPFVARACSSGDLLQFGP